MTSGRFLKKVLDSCGRVSYISPVPSAGGRSREASLGWDGSGACGRGHAKPGLGRPRAIRGCPAYWDHPRLIRPLRTTAGLPLRLEADREKAGASDLCKGQKL